MMRPQELLETYLEHLNAIHATGAGVEEESYYGALEHLLNAAGSALKPRVRAVIQLQNIGAGEPDGGLYTQEQLQRGMRDPLPGQKPARGKAVERDYTDTERAGLGDAADMLGATTFDIYLNDSAHWRNVPARVWSYTLGGYQVLKKWLSYREAKLLGRPLAHDEALYFASVARRIAALLLMAPELDRVYQAVVQGKGGR